MEPTQLELRGMVNGYLNNGVANLAAFDFTGGVNTGFVSLSDGGVESFHLTEAVPEEGPIHVYIGEAANNGEFLNGLLTVSDHAVN